MKLKADVKRNALEYVKTGNKEIKIPNSISNIFLLDQPETTIDDMLSLESLDNRSMFIKLADTVDFDSSEEEDEFIQKVSDLPSREGLSALHKIGESSPDLKEKIALKIATQDPTMETFNEIQKILFNWDDIDRKVIIEEAVNRFMETEYGTREEERIYSIIASSLRKLLKAGVIDMEYNKSIYGRLNAEVNKRKFGDKTNERV